MLLGLAAAVLGAGPATAETRQVELHHWVRRQGGMQRELLTRIPATVRDGSASLRLRRERGGLPPEVLEVRFEHLDTPVATIRQVEPIASAALAFEAGESVVRLESEAGRWSLRSATAEGDDPADIPAPGSWELEVEARPTPAPRGRVTVALAGDALPSVQ